MDTSVSGSSDPRQARLSAAIRRLAELPLSRAEDATAIIDEMCEIGIPAEWRDEVVTLALDYQHSLGELAKIRDLCNGQSARLTTIGIELDRDGVHAVAARERQAAKAELAERKQMGSNLRRIRMAAGWSIAHAAALLEVTPRVYESTYEAQGRIPVRRRQRVEAWKHFLAGCGARLEDVIGGPINEARE